MIVSNIKIRKITRIALLLSDIISVLMPAFLIYTFSDNLDGHANLRIKTIVGVVFFAISILVCSQTLYEQYSVRRSFYDEIKELSQIFIFNGLTSLAALFVFELSTEKSKHIYFLVAVFGILPLLRQFTRVVLNFFGLWKLHCIILSPQSEFKYVKAAIESQFNLGMTARRSSLETWMLTRLIRDAETSNSNNLADIKKEIHNYHSKIGDPHIVVFAHRKNALFIPKIIELIMFCDLPHSLISDVGGASLLGMRISHLFRWELLLITPQNNIGRISYRFIKRSTDLFLSIILILFLSIPMLIVYLIIKIDGGPGLFLHERVGTGGTKFKCLKFRTMQKNSDEILEKYFKDYPNSINEWNKHHKLKNDPRVTRFGKFLRRSSLDELPQLFNVLIGNMSLVGPRPIIQDEVSKYGKNIEMYYKVRPGMTGLWQISGRSNTSYDFRVSMDIWYIKNWSIWYDAGIILKTVAVVVSKVGAR